MFIFLFFLLCSFIVLSYLFAPNKDYFLSSIGIKTFASILILGSVLIVAASNKIAKRACAPLGKIVDLLEHFLKENVLPKENGKSTFSELQSL